MENDKLISIEEFTTMKSYKKKSQKQIDMKQLQALYHENPINKKYCVTLIMFDDQTRLFTADSINELAEMLQADGLLKAKKFKEISKYNKEKLTVDRLMKMYTYIDKHSSYYTEIDEV